MRAFVLMTALALATGCTSAVDALDEIFLSPNEADALVVNFEASVDAQQELSELVFAATRGDLDLVNDFANVDYVPPSELNNWTGSLTITDGVYAFGGHGFGSYLPRDRRDYLVAVTEAARKETR